MLGGGTNRKQRGVRDEHKAVQVSIDSNNCIEEGDKDTAKWRRERDKTHTELCIKNLA